MHAEYKKETDKSFMILEVGQEEDGFSTHMLLENRITGLIDFEKRSFNGDTYFFYNITGKHSLKNKLLKERELRKLLQSLYCVAGELYSHFLEIRALLPEPEYIFREEDNYFFCYFPSRENCRAEETQATFAEQLLEITDHEDEGAVELVYRFYKMVKESEKGIMRILEDVLIQETLISEPEPEEEIYIYERESEEDVKKISFRDIPTIICFLVALVVSLCYLGTEILPGNPKTARDVTVCVFALLTLPGITLGFVDIAKKK